MANPRTPTALRILAGNPGKRPLPASEPTFTPADTQAPEWLTGGALTRWNTLAAALDANGMLNVGNRDSLAVYCDLMTRYIDARTAGDEPDLKIFQQLRMMAREFGFTPSSQAGVVAPGKKKDDTKARFFG
jgi:phage terminase small subunit